MSEYDPSQDPLQDHESRVFQQAEMRRYRPEGLAEMGEILEPVRLRTVTHEYVARDIELDYQLRQRPNDYQTNRVAESLHEGSVRMRRLLPLGIVEPTHQEIKSGLIAMPAQAVDTRPLKFSETELNPYVRESGVVDEVREVQGKIVQVQVWQVNGKPIGLYSQDHRGREFITEETPEVTAAEARERRLKLAQEREMSMRLIGAWQNILAKTEEQRAFSADVESYAKQAFIRVGKTIALSRSYGEVTRQPESMSGNPEQGRLVEQAYETFLDIAEQRAVIEMYDPKSDGMKVYRVPNPFAYAKNKGLMDLSLHYIQLRLLNDNPPPENIKNDPDKLNAWTHDLSVAAKKALKLADHWDFDSENAFELDINEDGEIANIRKFELAMTDYAKVTWASQRFNSEYYGHSLGKAGLLKDEKERREYKRATGSPMGFVLPKGPGHALDMIPVEVVAKNKNGESRKIRVSANVLAYGNYYHKPVSQAELNADPQRLVARDAVITEDGNRQTSVLRSKKSDQVNEVTDRWYFNCTNLSGIPWDSIALVMGEANDLIQMPLEEGLEHAYLVDTSRLNSGTIAKPVENGGLGAVLLPFAEGPGTEAHEAPNKLAGMYYYAMVAEFMRSDFSSQLAEYTAGGKLAKMNKTISSALSFVMSIHELSDDTKEKYERFIRISLLAGLSAAVLESEASYSPTGSSAESRAQIAVGHTKADVEKLVKVALAEEFFKCKAVTASGKYEWKNQEDEELFNRIIANRATGMPLLPFNLQNDRPDGKKFGFTTAQLREIKRMYKFEEWNQ